MTSRDFVYWLQGFFEIGYLEGESLDGERVEMIRKHLNLVFVHEIDPSMGPKEIQDKLNLIHGSGKPVASGMTPDSNTKYRC